MISDEDLNSLISIIRNQFVDIGKIISLVDANKATEFRKRNQIAHV